MKYRRDFDSWHQEWGKEEARENGQEMEKRETRERKTAQTLGVLSLCPNDIFAHSFELVPGINISSCRQRE